MNIIVTGSLGHISKPLAQELIEKGHTVTVISSNPEKQKDIEALGAMAAIGSVEDADFLAATFSGADAVYCMMPPKNYFDHSFDLMAFALRVGNNYAQAIQQSGVKRAVILSSIGAHLAEGNGLIAVYHQIEAILSKLTDVAITFMRPASFYYNLYGYADMIKNAGLIAANYGGEDVIPWVSPVDIAAAIAAELETPQTGHKVRYVASEELTGNESAALLGAAIGKPDLQWIIVSDEEVQAALEAIGMNPEIAAGLVEMYASLHNGTFAEDYYRNRPTEMGKVKLKDFAKEFAAAFTASNVA